MNINYPTLLETFNSRHRFVFFTPIHSISLVFIRLSLEILERACALRDVLPRLIGRRLLFLETSRARARINAAKTKVARQRESRNEITLAKTLS